MIISIRARASDCTCVAALVAVRLQDFWGQGWCSCCAKTGDNPNMRSANSKGRDLRRLACLIGPSIENSPAVYTMAATF
jgi:hypothetical protein